MSTPGSSAPLGLAPSEMAEIVVAIAEKKAGTGSVKLFLLAILAGMYIAFGAVFSVLSVTGMAGVWPYGFTRIIAGLTFCLGLVLVVISGAELFTGNNLMVIAWINKRITLSAMLRNWGIVYAGNFFGSIFIAVLILASRLYTASNGELGKLMLTVADHKLHYSFLTALTLGILCNMLVCLAVWMTFSAPTSGGKILAILFPITAFIAAGFEHSVANMYVIPVAILLKGFDASFVSTLQIDTSAITWANFFVQNLLPVTLGNILGGAGLIGAFYAIIYPVKKKD
ncbi:MAG: formate/nitrite family transporter [Anaerolineaceae bacterium]|nr:formate/nitrite family transporter [Anaerolineaceae bacterium]